MLLDPVMRIIATGLWLPATLAYGLTAMLLMEALFGLPGLIAAPIAYAWIKDELTGAGLV